MNPVLLIRTGVLAAAVTHCAYAAAPESFAWRQPLNGPFTEGHLYRAPIPPELFDGCVRGPSSDLRMFDPAGNEWPFLVWTETRTETETAVATRRCNEMTTNYGLQFDLEIAEDGTGGHDRIRLNFKGNDYIRRVEIFGRENPGDDWGQLGAGFVVRIPRNPAVREDTVGYAFSTFRFLRVRLHRDVRRANDRFDPPACVILRGGGSPTPRDISAFERQEIPPSAEKRPGVQTVYLRQPWARPVAELCLSASGSYARDVAVFVRRSATNEWNWAGGGRITRMPGRTNEMVTLQETDAPLWRIDIVRGDDPELGDLSVEGRSLRRWIVFEARQNAARADCLFGSDRVGAPAYDLGRRCGDPVRAAPAAFGVREANPAHRPARTPPRWIAPAGVALASVIVLTVILGMTRDFLRRPPGSNGDPPEPIR